MKEHQQLPEEERLALEVFDSFGGKNPLLFVSDFDGTLCDEFEFDPETNNHLPKLDSEIIELASKRPVILATGRRSGHPALSHIRLSGLIDVETPFISENGGVVNLPNGAGFMHAVNLVEIETIRQIMSWGGRNFTKNKKPTRKSKICREARQYNVGRPHTGRHRS